jgi:Transposase
MVRGATGRVVRADPLGDRRLVGPSRLTFDTVLLWATQVADPFHLVKLANQRLDEVRRRVQNDTFGHRGYKHDPFYRSRRLLTRADERLDDRGRTRLVGLLDAGDPHGEVRTAWHAIGSRPVDLRPPRPDPGPRVRHPTRP